MNDGTGEQPSSRVSSVSGGGGGDNHDAGDQHHNGSNDNANPDHVEEDNESPQRPPPPVCWTGCVCAAADNHLIVSRARSASLLAIAHGHRIVELLSQPSLLNAALQLMRARKFFRDLRQRSGLDYVRDLFAWARHDPRLDWLRAYLAANVDARPEDPGVDSLVCLLLAWAAKLHARLVLAVAPTARPEEADVASAAPLPLLWIELLTDYWVPIRQDEYDQPQLCVQSARLERLSALLAVHRNFTVLDVSAHYLQTPRERAVLHNTRQWLGLNCCDWWSRTLDTWAVRCGADPSRMLDRHSCRLCRVYKEDRRPAAPTRQAYADRSCPGAAFVHSDQLFGPNFRRSGRADPPLIAYPSHAHPVYSRVAPPRRAANTAANCFYSRMSLYRLRGEYEWLCRGMQVRPGEKPVGVLYSDSPVMDTEGCRGGQRRHVGRATTTTTSGRSASPDSSSIVTSTAGGAEAASSKKFPVYLYGGWQTRRYEPTACLPATVDSWPGWLPVYHAVMVPVHAVHVTDLPRPLHALHLARRNGIPASRALVSRFPAAVYFGLVVLRRDETALRSVYYAARVRALTRWFRGVRLVRLVCRVARRGVAAAVSASFPVSPSRAADDRTASIFVSSSLLFSPLDYRVHRDTRKRGDRRTSISEASTLSSWSVIDEPSSSSIITGCT